MALAATMVTLLLLGATGPATLNATPPGPTGIKLYPYPKKPTKVGDVFTTCRVRKPITGGTMDIRSTTADHRWDLEIYLKPWRGGNQTYILYYGSMHPGVTVSGGGSYFSTSFEPPAGIYVHPAGKLAFSSGGGVVTLATTTYDGPYTNEVYLEGAMLCPALGS
jgi:hypothetical protein